MVDKKTQAQHWAGKDLKIIQSYWDSPPATKRSKWFVEQLRNYEFDSIGEVGFFAGRNLRYIREAFPDKQVSGVEVNPKAVKFAQEKLGSDVRLLCEDLHDLDFVNWEADIIFTSGVLIHVPPETMRNVIEVQIVPAAFKYVMHLEQLGNNEVAAGPKHMKPTYKVSDQVQWNPDLVSIYKDLGYDPQVIPLPEEVQTNGARELVVVKV